MTWLAHLSRIRYAREKTAAGAVQEGEQALRCLPHGSGLGADSLGPAGLLKGIRIDSFERNRRGLSNPRDAGWMSPDYFKEALVSVDLRSGRGVIEL